MSRVNPVLKLYSAHDLDALAQMRDLTADQVHDLKVIAQVLPFRTNNYVVEELIDWQRGPDDPMFQLTFGNRGFLRPDLFSQVADTIRHAGFKSEQLQEAVARMRAELNPHPSGQLECNVPAWKGEALQGVQHKYKETILLFPPAGQTCFAFCSFCFRWPQFVNDQSLKMAVRNDLLVADYIRHHHEITDILITGGDPMMMTARKFYEFIERYLAPEYAHIQTIRIGSKVLSFWPYRFLTDPDADQYLRIFEKIAQSGKHLALMAHFNHPRELATEAVQQAILRLQDTGLTLRAQSPLLKHINAEPETWAALWNRQVELGIIPYYMFVARDTGPRDYFKTTLDESLRIYAEAFSKVSGLGRTVRGPVMSAHPGKIQLLGVEQIHHEKVFVLKFLQGRRASWCDRVFFARYDRDASWFDELRPAFGAREFFFEQEQHESEAPLDILPGVG
jgi:KamA family protein